MAASPTPRHQSYSSATPTYYSAVRGGGITPSPGSTASVSASASAAALVPPPPLGGFPALEEGKEGAGDAAVDAGGSGGGGGGPDATVDLQSRLSRLRARSQDLSSELTRRLATSRSGQSLLHIGPSLSSLPPDLSSLLGALGPMLEDVSGYEAENRAELERVVARGRAVKGAVRRRRFAAECAETYRDLAGAEEVLRRDAERRLAEDHGVGGATGRSKKETGGRRGGALNPTDYEDDEDDEEMDHASSLERAAYTTLHLLRELESSSAEVSAIATGAGAGGGGGGVGSDEAKAGNILPSLDGPEEGANSAVMEKSRFLTKLAPRIRRLEADAARCLVGRLESLLAKVRRLAEDSGAVGDAREGRSSDGEEARSSEDLLLMIGHCLRGLALLGRGADVESAFARVAVMPVVRARLSMGRLDEGGSRGECAGLFFLLDDIANTVRGMYGPILRSSEGMFAMDFVNNYCDDDDVIDDALSSSPTPVEVDLVTCGVWVPVATALTADPGVKMAVFSPGIANVLQANYGALDTFLSELAANLLAAPMGTKEEKKKGTAEPGDFSHLYYRPEIGARAIARAQARLYGHPATVDYYKRWNLPIYYQLRFAEFTKRLDKALELVRNEGWQANVFTGDKGDAERIRESPGFELPLFLELYDTLSSMWRSNVFLRPLTHRFLRGAVQLVGRVLTFVKEGLDGEIKFGGNDSTDVEKSSEDSDAGAPVETIVAVPSYFWNERVEDVAAVAWELTILDTCMSHDYLEAVAGTVCPPDRESQRSTHNSASELDEIRLLASEVLAESSGGISPLVSHSWNTLIVNSLASSCCTPLAAVKGVAATYRMTNRPPPTQASPFVATVLRPLAEFDAAYASRTPPQIGDGWKRQVVSSVSDKYAAAVEELIATVKRTEEALKSRKTRRMMAGGMSDGEKVKLQLYLDHQEFRSNVEKLGVDPLSVSGLVKLGDLTHEAEGLFAKQSK